ncbi:unnamed protein product [Moneuplotes crassus]|uniref:Uncharacterized protein n=1 Tax=Euplotes crassus TaxID=5936 RepID=A0AAD2D7M6_EUPCR|nr:unnamed protein product [Moneuplotes crassus]
MLTKEVNSRQIFDWIFHYVNFFLVSFYITSFLYELVLSRGRTLNELPIYLLILLPSILYHWNPQIKNNTFYRWYTHLMYSLFLILFGIIFALVLLFSETPKTYELHVFFVREILPLTIMGFSLLMLLNYSEQKIQPKYFISQEDRLCQGFMTA